MNTQTLGLATFGDTLPTRVDGIDVNGLLRDLGEASASSSSIELFRLCLSAQRVLLQASAGAHPKSAETRMNAASRAGARRSRAHRGPQLTDADYAAIVKRYEDAGDVQNADIIRRQWEVARGAHSDVAGLPAERRPNQHYEKANGVTYERT